jgi:hypothetical protein
MLLADASLYELLEKIDKELAAKVRAAGCLRCGGVLHSARYPRKPRCPIELSADYEWRASFCCDVDGCRRRATPPSLRFLGRKVYVGVVVVLASALAQQPARWATAKLRRLVGVRGRTLRRWRRWWHETMPKSAFWRIAKARLSPPVDERALPLSLLAAFPAGNEHDRMIGVLRFLSPLTTGSATAS